MVEEKKDPFLNGVVPTHHICVFSKSNALLTIDQVVIFNA